MHRVTGLLLLVAVLLSPLPARADISRVPVKVRLERPDRLPAAGREFTTSVVIEAARQVALRDVVLSGEGWDVTRWDAGSDLILTAGETRRIAFAATPAADFGPLVLTGDLEGRPLRREFRLTREAYGGLMPIDSDLLPPRRILPATGEKFPVAPRFTLAEMKGLAEVAPASVKPQSGASGVCTVTGNLTYWHATQSRWLPAFGAHAWVWIHPPTGLPYSVGTQNVDELGRFSIQIPDGVTISIGFSATSNAVVVQEDGLWEDNYSWSTTQVQIPSGMTQYDAGPVYPNHHHGALHICAAVTFAHNQYRDLGWDLTRVDLQWPDDDGDFYFEYFDELHISRDEAWNDNTVCHEYGHYWHHHHAHDMAFDYCNGICDDDDCGHCGWCPENDEVSWNEGCAQLLSRLSTAYIEEHAAFTPVHEGLDAVHDSPSCDWEPWIIENVPAGAAWDMADDDRGTETDNFRTDALGNTVYDQLDLSTWDILHIMADHCPIEGHEPYRWPAFFRCAAAYLDEMASPNATRAMLWETAWNWDLDLDEAPPAVPSGLTSSFPIGTPTQISLAGFYWPVPSDDMSGVCGYSVVLNPNTAVAPDYVVDTTEPYWWPSGQLAAGTYYFTVSAMDRAGKWSAGWATYGPVIILPPGTADLEPYAYAGWTAPLVLTSVLAPSAPDPVVQTNYIQGDNVYFHWGETNTGTGSTGNFQDRMVLDGAPVYISNLRNLGAGGSTASRNHGPVDLGVIGRHTVWVGLDGLDAVAEPVETDNIYAKQFVFMGETLDLQETVVRTAGLPAAFEGLERVPVGAPFYPNCDGFRIELCMYPELVWAVPEDPSHTLMLRLHDSDKSQSGYANPLATALSAPDRAAVLIQNTWETLLTSYNVGVVDGMQGGATYRIHRELGRMFALPDTIPASMAGDDCLDFYYTYNDLGESGWFTVKLANAYPGMLRMHLFNPGFTMGSLDDADVSLTCSSGDTVFYNTELAPGEMALTVVSRDPRFSGTGDYTVFAYVAKPDLVANTSSGWFANVVPQVGLPYAAATDPIPAPSRLAGGVDSTGFYWTLRNESPSAGTPIGLQRRVDLDGEYLFGSQFIDGLDPLQEVKAAQSGLWPVRGGRHTVTHRINSGHTIDEDDYANNTHGRQWVWEPGFLATGVTHSLPLPPNAYGGVSLVDEGTVAPNCNGYKFDTFVPNRGTTILATYGVGSASDIDVGYYTGADVQDGFTETHAHSTWSGAGGDFVLRYMVGPAAYRNYVGITRGAGLPVGACTLRAQTGSTWWNAAAGSSRSGVVEADTFLDLYILPLPSGLYRFTLSSPDELLGLSLHDLSGGYSSKTTPWDSGIVLQEEGEAGQDVSFLVTIPDPPPYPFGVVVWRTDGSSLAANASWTITISSDMTGVDEGTPGTPPAVSRLVGATPNPFHPRTTIAFEVARPGHCELTIHDIQGRRVRSLIDEERGMGRQTVSWDGRDDRGWETSSGLYLARLETADGGVSLLKLVYIK